MCRGFIAISKQTSSKDTDLDLKLDTSDPREKGRERRRVMKGNGNWRELGTLCLISVGFVQYAAFGSISSYQCGPK